MFLLLLKNILEPHYTQINFLFSYVSLGYGLIIRKIRGPDLFRSRLELPQAQGEIHVISVGAKGVAIYSKVPSSPLL